MTLEQPRLGRSHAATGLRSAGRTNVGPVRRFVDAQLSGDDTRPSTVGRVLVALLAIDLVVIVLDVTWHLVDAAGSVGDRPAIVSLDGEGSIAAFADLLKWLVAGWLVVSVRRRDRAWTLVGIATLLMLALDVLRIHERIADLLLTEIGSTGSVTAGEVITFALLATVVASLLAVAGHVVSGRELHLVSRFALLTLGLAFFGVLVQGVRAASQAILHVDALDETLGVIAHGGKMIVISLILVLALRTRMAPADRPWVARPDLDD